MLAHMCREPPGPRTWHAPAIEQKADLASDLSRSLALSVPIYQSASGFGSRGLAVSRPADPEEREADLVADRIMRSAHESCECGGSCGQCEGEETAGSTSGSVELTSPGLPLQRDGLTSRPSPEPASPVDDMQDPADPLAQFPTGERPKASAERTDKLTNKLTGPERRTEATDITRALASPGSALDPSDRTFMERQFETDFRDVRVHSGVEASAAAASVHANAFTVGRDVVFHTGQYAPRTAAGRRLLAHELTHVVQQWPSAMRLQKGIRNFNGVANSRVGRNETVQRAVCGTGCGCTECRGNKLAHPVVQVSTAATTLQRQTSSNILRHNGRWGDIDSPAVLSLWAKEWAINKLWVGSTLRAVQEQPEELPQFVSNVLPKLRAALYSSKEFTGSREARIDADEALMLRWEWIRDPVQAEFVERYTKHLVQALARTPEGTELVTRPEEISRVRHQPYDNIWWHRIDFVRRGRVYGPRGVMDIKACPRGSEDSCPRGLAPREIWFVLVRDPNWIYLSPNQSVDDFDWFIQAVSGQVAASTQFAAQLFPFLLQLGGFSLGLSSRLAVILASEILTSLGEQGVRAARGEKMRSALDVLAGIGFGVITSHFAGRLFNTSRGRALTQNLDEAIDIAAVKARVEVARTDTKLVQRELQAGNARLVDDPDLVAKGYQTEVTIVSEGQVHTWRQRVDGTWCRFSNGELCVRELGAIVKLRQIPRALKAGARAVFGAGKTLTRPRMGQALKAAGAVDPRLLELARTARTDLVNAGVDWGTSNVVTAKVLVDGKEVWIVVDNPEWALHAEGALITEVQELKRASRGLKVEVKQVFSERIPCGENYAGCMRNVTGAFPEAEVFYGVTGPMTEHTTTRALWVMYGLIK